MVWIYGKSALISELILDKSNQSGSFSGFSSIVYSVLEFADLLL